MSRINHDWRNSCLEPQEIKVAATVQRKIQHFTALNDVTELSTCGVHLDRVCRHIHCLLDGPDLQPKICAVVLINQQRDICSHNLEKSFCHDVNAVVRR